MRTREEIARAIARDVEPGWSVNLGIGMPTLVARFLEGSSVLVHSENGILGMGPPPPAGQEDPDLVDAGKNPATVVPGGSYFDSTTSFAMVRGGHLDLAVLGAYQVSATGDLANWKRPGSKVPAIGGAGDLAVGARRVWVAMEHRDRRGAPKLVDSCTYSLTARACVARIYTDLATLEPTDHGFRVLELVDGVDLDTVASATLAHVEYADAVGAATAAEGGQG